MLLLTNLLSIINTLLDSGLLRLVLATVIRWPKLHITRLCDFRRPCFRIKIFYQYSSPVKTKFLLNATWNEHGPIVHMWPAHGTYEFWCYTNVHSSSSRTCKMRGPVRALKSVIKIASYFSKQMQTLWVPLVTLFHRTKGVSWLKQTVQSHITACLNDVKSTHETIVSPLLIDKTCRLLPSVRDGGNVPGQRWQRSVWCPNSRTRPRFNRRREGCKPWGRSRDTTEEHRGTE